MIKNDCKLFYGRFRIESFEVAHADIELPDELYNKFIEMAPVFVVQEISDYNIPKGMKIYKEKSGRKTIKRSKKLLGVIKA